MLLAAAGQAAPYTYDSSATRKIGSNNNNNNNNNSSNSSINNNINNNNVNSSTPTTTLGAAGTLAAATGARPTTASSIASNAATALMKTLSVRLHRGTEFIKDTVHKALVMSAATTPVLQSQANLKRKLTGAGGIMGSTSTSTSSTSGGSSSNTSNSNTANTSSSSSSSSNSRQFALSQPYVVPTVAFLRHFTVAPGALHRSATARKRNPSTDSLLMDLCLFKPIRPMPITPIKINKARGFELKRPKFVAPTANLYSDDEDDDEEEYDEEEEEAARKEQEVALKPKLSTLTLPQHATASAFVPHEANISSHTQINAHTKDNSNTHTSGTTGSAVGDDDNASASAIAKPKAAANKRRRRAPLLTAKRRRKPAAATKAPAAVASAGNAVSAAAAAPKRKRRTSISPMRHSPPMTRQRARLQISTSSN